MNDVLSGDGDGGKGSVSDRAAGGEHRDEPEQMFPVGSLDGDGIAPNRWIKDGVPTELVVSLSKAEVPLHGAGLPDANGYGRCMVTYLPGKKHELPIREDKNETAKVTGKKVSVDLRATFVQDANDVPALVRREFEGLLATSPAAAGKLLDEFKALAEQALQAA